MRLITLVTAVFFAALFILSGGHSNPVGAQSNEGTEQTTIHLPLIQQPGSRTIVTGASDGIWISRQEIMSLPTNGSGWQNLMEWAGDNTSNPRLSDQNDQTDAAVVAKALVYVRTGEARYRNEVVDAIMSAMGTEAGSGILAIGRNLAGYVIAAELVGLDAADDALFRTWLDAVRFEIFDGAGPSLSVVSCHEERPNNFGTHCGTSRLVAALYLNDQAEVERAARVFQGWLGDRNAYADFKFGSDSTWQCNPDRPVAVNPAGCTKDGHSIDGVLPDDQRRAGSFKWPAPAENYVWEALQGAVAQARILDRLGYDAFNWSDQALLRAVTWLYEEADYPAEADDSATPWLINHVYGSNFPARSVSDPGKNGLGFYDWYFVR